jgi:hypothetical protein
MTKYFSVNTEFTTESDNGKLKKQTLTYLVDAQSVTEAEARVVKYLSDRGEFQFEVKSATSSKIVEVITL